MKSRELLGRLSWFLARGNLFSLASLAADGLLQLWDWCTGTEFGKLHAAVRPYTTCGTARLRALAGAVQHVVQREIPGDLVECGTARGGSAALMGLVLKQLGARRIVWAFDTFEGLPPPSEADPDRVIARLYTGTFQADVKEVGALFERLGIRHLCWPVPGRFQETLPVSGVERIAVLHLDCDWYESVRTCLEQLYDRVSPGGVIQIDDYGHWAGARRAVDEFLRRRGIHHPLRRLDYAGRQLVKR